MQINYIIWGLALYLLVINLVAFLAFAYDKYCARNGMWRVRESTLLMIALIGGTMGSMVGQSVLHHKTYKQPFGSQLYFIAFLQVLILLALVVPQSRQALFALF